MSSTRKSPQSYAPFTKMQAVGNDFVLVDQAQWPEDADWSQQALRLCDRHRGIGADGLLVVGPSAVADIRMRMYNPDGTEDMCGNGLRCVVRYGLAHGFFDRLVRHCAQDEGDAAFVIGLAETLDGLHMFELDLQDPPGRNFRDDPGADIPIAIELYPPRFAARDVPMDGPDGTAEVQGFPLPLEDIGSVAVSSVNTGSTHTVIWVNELPEDERFFAVSPRIENHPLYPERTSVLWAALGGRTADDIRRIKVRIWERGVGETLGCGTGACAVAALAVAEGRVARSDDWVAVDSAGGILQVHWNGDPSSPVRLFGPAAIVYQGLVPVERRVPEAISNA
jgi:diaminopimelate epimerase